MTQPALAAEDYLVDPNSPVAVSASPQTEKDIQKLNALNEKY